MPKTNQKTPMTGADKSGKSCIVAINLASVAIAHKLLQEKRRKLKYKRWPE